MHLKAVSRTQPRNSSTHSAHAWNMHCNKFHQMKHVTQRGKLLSTLDAVALLKSHLAAEVWPQGCSQATALLP